MTSGGAEATQRGASKLPRIVPLALLAMTIGGHATIAQTAIPPAPQDFLVAAAQGDQYEIMAGHLAMVQGHDPRVRTFAAEMIRYHTQVNQELRRTAATTGLHAPASGMSSDEAALLSGLQSLRGAEFDRAYARQQVLVHTQDVAVEESFADAGADPSLRKTAQSALPTIKDHLLKAQKLRIETDGG